MNLYAVIFYILSAAIVISTALAITRRNLVHAVIYLVLSFFGTAMLFYLFGAPLLAALEVIIYAGAIMILFLFIIMMLKTETITEKLFPLNQILPATVLGIIFLAVGGALVISDPGSQTPLKTAVAGPAEFGRYVFENHWLAVEIVSVLLLVAVMGALLLGKEVIRRDLQSEDEP